MSESPTTIIREVWATPAEFRRGLMLAFPGRVVERNGELCADDGPAAMAITDQATEVFLDVNQTFLDTVGYARDEVVGRTAGDLKLFTKPGLREEILQALREQGSVRLLEVSLNRRDGATRTGLFGADLLDVGGEARLLTTLLDITERLAVEAELREQPPPRSVNAM